MAALLARLIAAQRSGGTVVEVPLGRLARLRRGAGAEATSFGMPAGGVTAVPGLVEPPTSRELEGRRQRRWLAGPTRPSASQLVVTLTREEARQRCRGQAARRTARSRRPRTRAQPDPTSSDATRRSQLDRRRHHRRSEKIHQSGTGLAATVPAAGRLTSVSRTPDLGATAACGDSTGHVHFRVTTGAGGSHTVLA